MSHLNGFSEYRDGLITLVMLYPRPSFCQHGEAFLPDFVSFSYYS